MVERLRNLNFTGGNIKKEFDLGDSANGNGYKA